MPSTTGLPPQLQRRTCSRNRFSSFSTLLILPSRFRSRPLSSSRGCFRRFSFAPTFFCLLSLAFHDLQLYLFLISLSFIFRMLLFRPLLRTFFQALAIFLLESRLLPRSLSSSPFLAGSFIISPACIFARTRSPRLIRFLLIVALAADARDVSFERDLSLYRRDRPPAREAFQHRGKAKLPPSEFRTVSI